MHSTTVDREVQYSIKSYHLHTRHLQFLFSVHMGIFVRCLCLNVTVHLLSRPVSLADASLAPILAKTTIKRSIINVLFFQNILCLIFVLVSDNASLALAVLQRFAFESRDILISAQLNLIQSLFIFHPHYNNRYLFQRWFCFRGCFVIGVWTTLRDSIAWWLEMYFLLELSIGYIFAKRRKLIKDLRIVES